MDKYGTAVDMIRKALDNLSPEESRRVVVAALELEGMGAMLRKDDGVLSDLMKAEGEKEAAGD